MPHPAAWLRNGLVRLAFAAALLAPNSAFSADDEAIADLVAVRNDIARALSGPIVDCIRRHDTDHPVFHGCIDWHSAVHAHWALTAVARVTGNRKLLDAITARLRPDLIAEEHRDLAGSPGFEMPYGRAWFLRFAIEYATATGDRRLEPMADQLAASLADYLDGRGLDPLTGSYDSGTWAYINLRAYGVFRGDEGLVAFVDASVADARRANGGPCRFDLDERQRSFMAICANWAWLVGESIDGDAGALAMGSIIPPDADLTPVTRPANDHLFGLDFSRAWGLWRLWRRTGEPAYLTAYADHFRVAYRNRAWWAGDYRAVGHWVAQFGVLAMLPLFEPGYR